MQRLIDYAHSTLAINESASSLLNVVLEHCVVSFGHVYGSQEGEGEGGGGLSHMYTRYPG